MKKFVTKDYGGKFPSAITKAKDDFSYFAQEMNYQPLAYNAYYWPDEPQDFLSGRFDGMLAAVKEGDLVVHQYPSKDFSLSWDIAFLQRLKDKHIKSALMVHDLDFIGRLELYGSDTQTQEIGLLNSADVVITMSQAMTKALNKYGVTKPMVEKPFWDYLVRGYDAPLPNDSKMEKKLIWAGNTFKAPFIKNWPCQTDLGYFGDDLGNIENKHIQYYGSFWHDELVRKMPRSYFGLIWNENIDQHIFKDYQRWNAPHKAGLYLALGMPIIAWQEAAVSDFIREYKIGFTINSLDEIDSILANLTEKQMAQMRHNANCFGVMLRDGRFTREALSKVENILYAQGFEK